MCLSDVTCPQVCPSDPQSPSPILLAEKAGQALQTELLRLNEFTGDTHTHTRVYLRYVAASLAHLDLTVCVLLLLQRLPTLSATVGQ